MAAADVNDAAPGAQWSFPVNVAHLKEPAYPMDVSVLLTTQEAPYYNKTRGRISLVPDALGGHYVFTPEGTAAPFRLRPQLRTQQVYLADTGERWQCYMYHAMSSK